MSKLNRMVQVLHKLTTAGREALTVRAKTKAINHKDVREHLAVGNRFKFQSGAEYLVTPTGAVLRTNGRPWRSKAQRKAQRKAAQKEAADAT